MAGTMNTDNPTQLEHEWFRERERAVSSLRLAFAVLAIVVIQLNPSRVAHYPALSKVILISFLIYSAAAVWLVWKNKFPLSSFGAISTALDVIWIALIVISTGGTRTPFFFYYSFPVITASLRWGLKGSLPVAFIGVGIYVSIRLTLAQNRLASRSGSTPSSCAASISLSLLLSSDTSASSNKSRIASCWPSRAQPGSWPHCKSAIESCTSCTTACSNHSRP